MKLTVAACSFEIDMAKYGRIQCFVLLRFSCSVSA